MSENKKSKVSSDTKINAYVREFNKLGEPEKVIVRQEIEDGKIEGRKILRQMGIIS